MSIVRGAMVTITRKHKINVVSLSELEVVSIANVLDILLWCKYFMEA